VPPHADQNSALFMTSAIAAPCFAACSAK